MIDTSLAILALSASAAVSPLSKLVHLHPHVAQADTRISITIHNQSSMFQDVMIDGKTYTVLHDRGLTIKAPAGTPIYYASGNGSHRRGELLAEVTPQLAETSINLK